ncbi:helix-turn-helix domain-containing protein [Nocardioides sp. ChNu-153]|uniref:helix-turn-helix domain-containing protein n=1 Tax=unclassified Nocardioides TaxID=2615069 RepID=UPI002405460C|nr:MULTISPECIES: helix-turn-helix transcriptional regulator [unclassified Nocardioides]MDF9716748.1 helix-turn-helix transcriptional regulator [Nocardioides sp. ChNu-99]MDN7121960.1 helix-turn-helix domain-containing protein [Nocardioides sp. ChNu-153]
MTQAELRDFLRAARARVRPDAASALGDDTLTRTRRVKGLRREEVARIAGVSVDYYTRLEQGRAGAPSSVVLTGVARALRLDPAEQAYFFALAGDAPAVSTETVSPPQRVRPGVHKMMAAMTDSPAFVHGVGLQVLAMNDLARKVFFDAEALPFRERNLARFTFLDPVARERYVDWEESAATTAAVLRADAGLHPDDRALHELVGELSVRSPEFAGLWAEHRVHDCTWGTKRLRHPLVGELDLTWEALDVPGAAGQKLKVYTAEPGSPAADALRLIGAWQG